MKNTKAFSLLSVLLTLALTAALPPAAAGAAQKNIVYVRDGGTGDGSSAASPLSSLLTAYQKLGDAGGEIAVCGDLTLPAPFQEPRHEGTVTITQIEDDVDYRGTGALRVDPAGTFKRYILGGPTVFENVRFATQNKAGLIVIAEYNPVTIGEGVICEGFDYSLIANAFTVLGGHQNGLPASLIAGNTARVTIKGGQVLLVGLDRQYNANHDRCAEIGIYGGTVEKFYAGNVNGGTGKNATVKVYGGTVKGAFDCAYGLSGDTTLEVSGGDFSGCTNINGATPETSTAILSEGTEAAVKPLLTGFRNIKTASGLSHQYIPDEVFGAAVFTDSRGTTLPYRYYFPEGYDKNADKTYPVLFYFHGNGSRGDDNKSQLNPTHAIVSLVLNSEYDCIIVAPQCPKSDAWIKDANYPGGTGFDPMKTPESAHLAAATELFNKLLREEKIDPARIYLSGGSNGAAACWSTIAHSPKTAAAAVILAGTGSTGGAQNIAEYYLYTPIWTFHGDADTTLSVNGTRGIVNAVLALGGTKMTYTEMPGYAHNIWIDATATEGLLDWMFSQTRPDSVGLFRLGSESDKTREDLLSLRSGTEETAPPPVETAPAPVETAPPETSPSAKGETAPAVTAAPETRAAVSSGTAGTAPVTAGAAAGTETAPQTARADTDGAAATSRSGETGKKGTPWYLWAILGGAAVAAGAAAAIFSARKKKK